MKDQNSRRGRSAAPTIAVLSTALIIGGCGFDPSSIPVPGTTVSGQTYPLHIQFANVLNLPPGAKVIANGVQVGDLTGVRVHGPGDAVKTGYVVADITVQSAVQLPTSTTAELRQDTPLGDVHIALITPPGNPGPMLASDATIPIAHTSQPPQVEGIMAGLATATGSGLVTNFQDIIRQLNDVLPRDPNEIARVFGVLGANLTDVAANLGSVDSVLDGLELNARQIVDDKDILGKLLTDYGVQHVTDVFGSVIQIILVLAGLGPLSHHALWLSPMVQSLDDAAKAVVPVLFTESPWTRARPRI